MQKMGSVGIFQSTFLEATTQHWRNRLGG